MIRVKKSSKVKKPKEISAGTIRVEAKSLQAYSKTKTGWKKIKRRFAELENVVYLFHATDNFEILVDTKNPRFLKGQLSVEGREQGARINVLPNREKLEKAFSLFSNHLQIHDQDSHDHWDVLYQNKGGTWSYVYTLEKRKKHMARKYMKVEKFAKKYEVLHSNVENALFDSKDNMALPMYTLLHTFMRVGNEVYYKTHGHKGLTTLMKSDVEIYGNEVSFSFLGKDGVPQLLSYDFPKLYVKRLQKLLSCKKDKDFVFTNNGRLLHERDFKKAFNKYCGEEFYPHIVRSYYASSCVQTALKNCDSFSHETMEHLFLSIAHGLGHKKFDKKINEWKDNYSVTVRSYVQPELFAAVMKRVEK
tara:strand:+ start:71 stop:1153 length:1083 start_codon:yes stop_codon:yes gene_type:complete